MWSRGTGPNCRESVLAAELSPTRKMAPAGSIARIRLMISSSGRSGRRATTTSPTRSKEERAELAKHHLDVLWSDWYKPEKHDAKFPQLKDILKQAVTQGSKAKASVDLNEAQKLLDLIDQVDQIWQKAGGPQETRIARASAAPTRA